MRLNECEKLAGERCLLIPYCRKHVEQYNRWMQDPELLRLTSSEPLTLNEEYRMQQSWQLDDNKLTFIILDRATYEQTNNEIFAMAGDINVFLIEESIDSELEPSNGLEISLMIAEKRFRSKGLAQEALALMIQYICEKKISNNNSIILAKIDEDNLPSLNLFKKMHFSELQYDRIFKSFTLKFDMEKLEEIQKRFLMQILLYRNL